MAVASTSSPPLASCNAADAWSQLHSLLLLNLALQLFDGVATYNGVSLGWLEANPLLVNAFASLGLVPALLLFKALACGLLLLLYRTAPRSLVNHSLRALAVVYCVFSLGPWLAKFIALLSDGV